MKAKAANDDAATELLRDFSLEMTGKDVDALREAGSEIPTGTRINLTFLGNEDLEQRVTAARAILDRGDVPVPHLSARRLRDASELAEYLDRLAEIGASERVLVVGGDPSEPLGPYADALSIIESGTLEQHGVREVSISGYPEGHPDIDDDRLWGALGDKIAALEQRSLSGMIVTQFGFDADTVERWIREVRTRGFDIPIRIGVPGPAGIKRLLGYARRFGVSTSAGIVEKYGFSLANLLGTAGPDRFVDDLAGRLDDRTGEVGIHLYTFGGIRASAEWAQRYLSQHSGQRV